MSIRARSAQRRSGRAGEPPAKALVRRVHVCPLAELEAALAGTGATHLISVINADTIPATPGHLAAGRHLKLGVNDISEPRDGFIHPSEAHISEIVAFARAWDDQGPMLVHCWAGISRSTAAAFITLCTVNPDAAEKRIAAALREASPTAMPNRLMVAIADDLLGRNGRMVDAISGMGPGEIAMTGRLFGLPSRFPG
jgi:predicted protein tyrosine phosphatase